MKVTLKNSVGLTREVKVGFSWTAFFFGGIPFFFRGMRLPGIIWLVLSICTFGISNLILMFIINKQTAHHYLETGYSQIGKGWNIASKAWGIEQQEMAIVDVNHTIHSGKLHNTPTTSVPVVDKTPDNPHKLSTWSQVFWGSIAGVVLITILISTSDDEKSPTQPIIKNTIAASPYVHKTDYQLIGEKVAAEVFDNDKDMYISKLPNFTTNFKTKMTSNDVKTKDGILVMAEMFKYAAVVVAASKTFTLTPQEQDVVDKYEQTVSNKQVELFPIMRDRYGPVIRNMGREIGMGGKTNGSKARVANFTGVAFYLDDNIPAFHSKLLSFLKQLRFTQVRYYTDPQMTGQYTYYDISVPKDSDVVIWDP